MDTSLRAGLLANREVDLNFIPLGGGLPRVVPTRGPQCQLLQGSD